MQLLSDTIFTVLMKHYTNALSMQEWTPAIIYSLKHERVLQEL